MEQGPNRTFHDSWRYGNKHQHLGLSELVLSSSSPLIIITDVTPLKLEFGVTRTTRSGKFLHTIKQCIIPHEKEN